MSHPLQVGITGGIGSGKSTVAKIFNSLGVPVYDADSRAKWLMNSDDELVNQIRSEFGNDSYDTEGNLNRRYLAEHVFGFPDRLQKLNSFVHPRVAKDYQDWVNSNQSHAYLLKEAALLFEAGSANALDKIIVVMSPDNVRIARVIKRDGRSEAEVKNIISRQLPQEQNAAKADFVIMNDESQLLIPQVLELHHKFSKHTL